MTDLDTALQRAVGTPRGIEPAEVRVRVRRRRRRRLARRAALGVLALVAIAPAIVARTAARGPDGGVEPGGEAMGTTATTPPTTAATPDGIRLSWRTGVFPFAACASADPCPPGDPARVEERAGIEVDVAMPEGTRATGTAPTDLGAGPVGSARIEASWSMALTDEPFSPFLVAVTVGPAVDRVEMHYAGGAVDVRDDPRRLEVFAARSPTAMIRLDAFDGAGQVVASCVPVEGATGCR